MKKNEVFTFTAPNGVEVTAVVVAIMGGYEDTWATYTHYLCYAQRRLFKYCERTTFEETGINTAFAGYSLLADYAILPDYDNMLELHQAMDYPLWEQNMEKPDPDEGEDIFWDSCVEEHNKQEDV